MAFIESMIAEGLNNYASVPYLRVRRNISLDLIEDKARESNISVCFYENKYFELKGHGKAVIFHQNAPENSVVAASITKNKTLTKKILTRNQLPVPAGGIFDDYDEAALYFSTCKLPQVVKPNAGARSEGVTTNISTPAEFEKAWNAAGAGKKRIIVEDFVGGDYLRVFVIGGKAVGAYLCVPAYVVGNGTHDIATLIKEKNVLRSQNPATMGKKTLISRVDLLEKNGLTLQSIPAAAQRVELTAVANISAGGEAIEVVDRIHPTLLELAEQSVSVIPGLRVAGVDMLVRDFLKPALPHNAVILELNSNPAMDDHVFPMYGKPVDIPGLLIDYVFRDQRIGRKVATADFPRYTASCEGRAFSRNYDVQMEVIRQAAFRRNLCVDDISGSLFTLTDANRSVTFEEGMPDCTTSVARTASNRKDWTKRLLRASCVNTPRGQSFDVDAMEPAWRFAESMARPVVVKPRSGSGGKGVSVNVSTRDHFELAWDVARKSNPSSILVEEFLAANDYRLLVVGDHVRAAAQRIPAHVIGDGRHTVQELIDIKNRARQANPYLGAKIVKITPMIEFELKQQGIHVTTVLSDGQYLQLHAVANIGSGGDSKDVSDIMHPEFADIAVRARKAVFDPAHAGIDLLAEDITKPPHAQRWLVIEVNTNPDLALHHFPSAGAPRDAAGALIEYLFPDARVVARGDEKAVNVMIHGQVKEVGFLKWIWRRAHLRGLSGWVRGNPDGAIEAALRGAPQAVDSMATLCRTGPRRATVTDVIVRLADVDADTSAGFVIR